MRPGTSQLLRPRLSPCIRQPHDTMEGRENQAALWPVFRYSSRDRQLQYTAVMLRLHPTTHLHTIQSMDQAQAALMASQQQ